jgi:orotidine-5'-phosphate decarboxylase
METLTLAKRLIVAADFKPDPGQPKLTNWRTNVGCQVLELAEKIQKTKAGIKVEGILGACGYDLIDELQALEVKVMADLKLSGIPQAMEIYGRLLQESQPEIVTVMCSTGRDSLQTLKQMLPTTKVLGVTVLTNIHESECQCTYENSVEDMALRLAGIGLHSGNLDGVVCSPAEVGGIRAMTNSIIAATNVRPTWAEVVDDDQNRERAMTPTEAIQAGADYLIVGRPITQHKDPYDAIMRILDEMAAAQSQAV